MTDQEVCSSRGTEYRWCNDLSLQFLKNGYLIEGQSLDERVDIICNTAEKILKIKGFAQRFKENFQKGWYSLSTPIWTNFGNDRGLPISCFGSQIDDTMESIVDTWAEVSMMTKCGGGTSAYFGNLRPRGSVVRNNGHSPGPVHFMQAFDTLIQVISQGSARRGSFSPYLGVDHPDIMEFLRIKSNGHPIQDLYFGVCVPDYWMEEMIAGDVEKRKVWARVLEVRNNIGFPYIFFHGNANKFKPEWYKDLEITHTNLCTEIMEPDSILESFVCCLASMNILYFDEWKDTDAPELLLYLLDAVMTEFIKKAKKIKHLDRAVRFAERHRAVGVGWFGWHSYLQSKMIPFESMQAKYLNVEVARTLKEKLESASTKLAELLGEADVCKGYNRRNALVSALAPTKSSAWIIGQASENAEPVRSNYCVKDLAKGKFSIKNPYLLKVLESKGKNTNDVWQSILMNGGSVQHLDFLSAEEKAVFKTFSEIAPMEILIQASQRQKYIDQGQSINLMIHPSMPTKDVNALMIEAWKLGLKSLYYQYSINAAQEFSRDLLTCTNCEA